MPNTSFLSHQDTLGAFRRTVLNRMLMVMMALATVAFVAVTVEELTQGDPARVFVVYLPVYVVFSVISLVRSIPFATRALLLVFIVAGIAVSEFYYFGVGSVGYMYAYAAVTLTGVFFGLRAGLITVGVSCAAGLGFAAAYELDLIPITTTVQTAAADFIVWVPPTASFLLVSAASITIISVLLRELDEAMEKTKAYAQELTQERDALASTLRERETLIQEIDHRVGNILQLLESLVRLEEDQQETGGEHGALSRMANRIHILAAVYNAVDRSDQRQRVDLAAVALRVCPRVLNRHDRDPSLVHVEMAPAVMTVDHAVPLALLIGEFVDYAVHESPDHQGSVSIRGAHADEYQLTLTLPKADAGGPKPSCMAIVGALVARVNGTMEWLSDPYPGLRMRFSCA